MKKILSVAAGVLVLASSVFADRSKVTVLYTNDVHTHIDNTVKDSLGNRVPGLTYSSVAAMKKQLEESGENVILVDAGDFAQGTIFGALDQGKSIVQLMNSAGYDAGTLGNHDFDFGIQALEGYLKQAKFPIVSCNLFKKGKPVTKPYTIITKGSARVCIIGIATPETLTKSSPINFMDKSKKKFLYSFAEDTTGNKLAATVQAVVDEVKDKADYIILLGHLGIDASSEPFRSVDLISKITGVDAFIDGHSHSVVEHQIVKDREGKDVVLTQTGSYLSSVGKMTLEGSDVATELVMKFDGRDEATDSISASFVSNILGKMGEVFAVSDVKFVMRTDDDSEWFIRKHETNLADFVTDAYYYHINEVEKIPCDAVLINAGGIRENMPAGDVNFIITKNVQPFGNQMCVIQLDGQSILDVLEFGARGAGAENVAGLIHVAGIKYSVDTGIPYTVKVDDKKKWVGGPSRYRVHDVQVYNIKAGKYEPLDLKKIYNVGGQNFLVRNMGDGFRIFANAQLVVDYLGEDYIFLSDYIKAFSGKDERGLPHVSSRNSPLSKYSGYLIDYENPDGSGRLVIE